MTGERIDPNDHANERTTLREFLDYQRATLRWKIDGVSDDAARTANIEPSDLSLLGLVRHMTLVEQVWFERWFEGSDRPLPYVTPDDRHGDFHCGPDATVADALAAWTVQCERSRQIEAAAPTLDAVTVRCETGPDGETRQPSLRWILVHMIEEYARHNGHADLLRERIDGATGE